MTSSGTSFSSNFRKEGRGKNVFFEIDRHGILDFRKVGYFKRLQGMGILKQLSADLVGHWTCLDLQVLQPLEKRGGEQCSKPG